VAKRATTRSEPFIAPDPVTVGIFLDGAPDAVVIVDQRERIAYVNPATERLFGYEADELRGETLEVVLPTRPRVTPLAQPSESQKAPKSRPVGQNWELVGRHKDGAAIPVEIRRSTVTTDQGTWVMSVIRDLRERRRGQAGRDRPQTDVAREQEDVKAEAQLARTVSSEWRALADTIPAGVIVADARGTIVFSNTAARQLLGGTITGTVYGSDSGCTLHRPDGTPFPPGELPLTRAIERGETMHDVAILVRHPERPERVMLNTAWVQRDSAGQVASASVVFQDITAFKELQRAREEWTSVIAHDLRQPLTVILAYAGKLASETSLPGLTTHAHTEHILRSARQLNRMIADLLDLSRIDLRRLTLGRRPVDLPAMLRDIVERSLEITKDHVVSVRTRGAIPTVELDPDRIEQVLVNLLSNAAKYSEEGCPIEVQITSGESDVEVAVTNRGPGIPSGELQAVFARFYRAERDQGGEVSGLGLGLYIAKGLVEAHGGRIWAESLPGETTTFRFTLPSATRGKAKS
jgi:PAS domain S-box-containing protein